MFKSLFDYVTKFNLCPLLRFWFMVFKFKYLWCYGSLGNGVVLKVIPLINLVFAENRLKGEYDMVPCRYNQKHVQYFFFRETPFRCLKFLNIDIFECLGIGILRYWNIKILEY